MANFGYLGIYVQFLGFFPSGTYRVTVTLSVVSQAFQDFSKLQETESVLVMYNTPSKLLDATFPKHPPDLAATCHPFPAINVLPRKYEWDWLVPCIGKYWFLGGKLAGIVFSKGFPTHLSGGVSFHQYRWSYKVFFKAFQRLVCWMVPNKKTAVRIDT